MTSYGLVNGLDYSLELILFGKEDQLKEMLKIVGLYSKEGDKNAYFNCIEAYGKKINFKNFNNNDLNLSEREVLWVKAFGPYGRYEELNDVSLFRDLAEAFPSGHFIGEITGCGEYEEEKLTCCLSDGLLKTTTFFKSYDDVCLAWKKKAYEKLKPVKCKKLFKIEGEELNEESCLEMVIEMIYDNYEDFSKITLDKFAENLKNIGGKSALDAEEFEDIMKRQLPELGIVSPQDFSNDYEGWFPENYVYDPVTKAYI